MMASFSQHLRPILWAFNIYLLSGIVVNAVEPESAAQQLNKTAKTPINLRALSSEDKKKFKDSYDTIFADCDGVLYDVHGVINNSPETVNELINEGKTIYFVTNNGSRTRAQFLDKLIKLGFKNVTEKSVINPLGLITDYLKEKLPEGKSAYVVGPQVVCDELLHSKIPCSGPGKDEMSDRMRENIFTAHHEFPEHVGAVIVGMDYDLSFMKILRAINFLRNKDVLFIITDPDETLCWEKGALVPGPATISAAIAVGSGRQPQLLSKPSPHIIKILQSMTNDPQRALFVGDTILTDILTGCKGSFKTVFALSGFNNLDDLKPYAESKDAEAQMYIPDYYINDLSDLLLK